MDDQLTEATWGSQTLTQTRAGEPPRELALPELVRGESIGRYLVLERLGAGGMGVVFAAYDPKLSRKVAIKLLRRRQRSEAAQARLVREAQALAQVTDPRVVVVHDVGVHDGRVFLAMEYVEGQTLREFEDGTHTLEQRLAVLITAGEGLAAAHRAGLVHRDFKPDNVMIAASGAVKVMDFGLARASEDSLSSDGADISELSGPTSRLVGSNLITEVGTVLGTPAYMAPELLAGQPADARSDQFAFAVTAYELLFGVRPFVGENLSALALAIAEGRIVEPKQRAPAWLRRVVRRGLATSPRERWPDLDQMLAALRDDPIRKRRKRSFAGGALGLSAAAGALLTWTLATRPSSPAICSEIVPGLDDRWTSSEREQLERALAGDPIRQTAVATTLALLDAYARDWDAANLDNCTSSHVAPRQSEQIHELRSSCLRQRKIAFEQLVVGLREEPSTRERSVEAAARLPVIGLCTDVTALLLEPPLPDDAARRESGEALGDELAAIETLIEMRHSDAALTRARELDRKARAFDHRPLEAEAALLLGRALVIDDALAAGVVELRRAYFTALAGGHARAQARAAAELVYTVGYLQQNHAQGGEWAEHGLAVVTRVDRGGLIEADMQHAVGVLRDSSGDHLGSLAAYTKAYEIRQAILPDPHPDLARSLNALGNIHQSLDEPAVAREYYERALAMRRVLFGDDHPIIAGSLNNLSLALRDQGELEQARATLELAVATIERSGGAHGNGLPRALTNLAEIERRLGALEHARELEERSLALRRASVGDQHPEVADSIVSLAKIARDQGRLDEAEAFARDGLGRLQRDFAPGHPETFSATLVLATVLEARGELERAAHLIAAAFADGRSEDLDPEDRRAAKALLERAGAGG